MTAALLVLTVSGAAHALTLFTPVSASSNGQFLACIITNVGTSPAIVSARLLDFSTGNDITQSSSCPAKPATLAPGASCSAALTAFASGYCQFDSSSSKVRGVLLTRNVGGGSVVNTLPATK
jgi:hypothetical protein